MCVLCSMPSARVLTARRNLPFTWRLLLRSDEIYANSVWGEGAAPFVSTEVLARQLAADLPTALVSE